MLQIFDLAVAWNWEYDADFIDLLERVFRERGLSLLQVTDETVDAIIDQVGRRTLEFRLLLDRASDTDEDYYPLTDWGCVTGTRILNQRPLAHRAWDKATMHLDFISAGLHTPYTIVLPPFDDEPDIASPDLSPLGDKMIMKPAHGGGGSSVTLKREQTSWQQIQQVRQQVPEDKYLLQDWVTPKQTGEGAAWFRVLFALGEAFPFWWDVQTHIYRPLTSDHFVQFNLSELVNIVQSIARICRLDIFSTEIALRANDEQFVSVDYVNDPIDLRLQSTAKDGVPDSTVRAIAERIADAALQRKANSQ